MIGKIINTLFKKSWSEKKLLLKEVALTVNEENIIRTIRAINKTTQGSLNNYVILDIGAFDGNTALSFSKAFPACKVMSFEPNPDMFEVAARNVKTNSKIAIQNIAISNSNSTVTFNVTANKVSSSINPINVSSSSEGVQKEFAVQKQVKVQAQTLDSLNIKEPILLMKIDTQGHEMAVLEGAVNTLPHVKHILVEMNNHDMYGNSSKYYDIDKWLREHNFSMIDLIVTYRKEGVFVTEFDGLYVNNKPVS